MSRQATLITAAFFAAAVCQAQSPVFEAVSIKPSSADAGGRSLSQNPGPRLSTSNATLKMLVMFAYQLMPDQISGGPGWVESDGFDVEAKGANPNATMGEFRRMVQAMLAERFHLQVHRATKELPVYALVQAKGGTKLTEAHGEDSGTGARVEDPGRISGVNATMAALALTLSRPLRRQVIDETGLKGTYSFKLNFVPDQKRRANPDEAAPPSDGPSIFTALEEQLGLALKASKGPVEVLVIDRAAKPEAN